MARLAKTELPWMAAVASRQVREGKNFRLACADEQVEGLSTELDAWQKSRSYQKCLRTERLAYYKELASDPNRSKNTLIGLMALAIEKLAEEGSWREVLEGGLKLAKLEGWVSGDTNVNVFGGLSARELAEVRAAVKPAPVEEIKPN